ncbi:hypothetical protein BHE74_00029139 [Ensete ventricosum]|nr:hypothetical protein BHE74_00029139 [Ensete ventricosum]
MLDLLYPPYLDFEKHGYMISLARSSQLHARVAGHGQAPYRWVTASDEAARGSPHSQGLPLVGAALAQGGTARPQGLPPKGSNALPRARVRVSFR